MTAIARWTGAESRALRLALRLTVEGFAERLGAGTRTVANWEGRGSSINPQPDWQAALDTLLERSSEAERARFWMMRSSARGLIGRGAEELTGLSRNWGPASPSSSISGPGHDDHARTPGKPHVARVPFLPAALERTALDWLLRLPTAPEAITASVVPPPRSEQAAAAQTALRLFRELDHRHGSGRVRGEVERYVAEHVSPMVESGATFRDGDSSLRAVAVGFFEFSGYQAVDTGADGVAQRRYARALQLSQAAGDRTYGAYLLAVSLGHLALHCNHPDVALRTALAAVEGAGETASPAVRAALHAVVARAHARLGQAKDCTAHLVTAESMLGHSVTGDEPAWIRYFTPAYLADEMAHCFFDLDDHPQAQRSVDVALASLQPGHLRRLAIDTSLLASSLAVQGRLDQASAVGRVAVDHAAATESQRCVQRVVALRVELELHRDQRDVREFLEHLKDALPSAA